MAASKHHRGSSPYRFSVNGGGLMGFAQTSTSSPHQQQQNSLNSSRFLPRPSPNRSAARGLAQVVPRNSPSAMYTPESIDPDQSCDFSGAAKENICVTIRFRPLSERESLRGDEAVWYVDENTVRNEYNPSAVYAYDKVFGATTSTRSVYDTAARHVVRGSMEGINGTVFAYGVTSSGKTHTMHGDPNFPGIIPLAVKDVFSIIQETSGRQFLLRVTYLEIYNEVINDLLDPAGQNLRIREDGQGTYVEGVKEEVVLSPSHALSLITAGEEHRHVGSNNFNLFSSRSHTIFTLTIESSVHGQESDEEATLSQLNLIDLAGSESSKTETTGLRRKEGSYINKSLLTLGTVISKLSEGRASHIPYRDSKLTRLLQSSLSGHGRISLICTITPASSNMEETHNTLKFAQRAKRIAIFAAPNRIIDERSLIKKYQKEIANLRKELQHFKRGMTETPYPVTNHEDLMTLRQQLEAGQMKMQSRLEEEEQSKAALMGRIHKLTKLILVSTKNNLSGAGHQRRHSIAESEESDQTEFEASSNALANSHPDVDCLDSQRPDSVADQIDLTREQVKMLAGEIALRSSSLKRLSKEAAYKPDDPQIQVQMKILRDDIEDKMNQMELLEQRVMDLGDNSSYQEMSQMLTKVTSQLNEKAFELEIRTADNRILEEQLKSKVSEIEELEERNVKLQQQLQEAVQKLSPQKAVLAPHNCLLDDDQWLENRRVTKKQDPGEAFLQIEILSQEKARLIEDKKNLIVRSTKLEEDAAYAKELASSAATEIKSLTEQLKKLLLQNSKLASDVESTSAEVDSLKVEVQSEREKRLSMEQALSGKDKVEVDLRRKVDEAKQREADLENDMANMWVLVAKMKAGEPLNQISSIPPAVQVTTSTLNIRRIKDQHKELEKLRAADKEDASALKALVSQLKDEDVESLDAVALEDLQALHIQALTKLCSAKAKIQERRKESKEDVGLSLQLYDDDDRRAHICKICFEAQTAAVLLPCRHFCLCQQCAVACTECPLCRTSISDRIITFAS